MAAFACNDAMVKSLTRDDSAVVIGFWMLIVQSIFGLVPALVQWRWPSAGVWGWVLVVAFCGTYSHYCMANALRHADEDFARELEVRVAEPLGRGRRCRLVRAAHCRERSGRAGR